MNTFDVRFSILYPDGLDMITIGGDCVKFSFGLKYFDVVRSIILIIYVNTTIDNMYSLFLNCSGVEFCPIDSYMFEKSAMSIERGVFLQNSDIELIFRSWKNGGLVELLCNMFSDLSANYFSYISESFVSEYLVDIAK